MTAAYLQVLHTYTSRRWPMLGIGVGAAVLLAMLTFAPAGQSADKPGSAMVGAQFVAFPIMLCVLLLASQAKYQFVHPRARLTPHFAAPHLTVLFALLLLLLGAFPAVAAWRLGYSLLGLLAFSALFAALVAWQNQVVRGTLMLVAMGLYLSFFHPTIAQFWIGSVPAWTPWRLAILVAGWCGIGLWLVRLTQMTEQDDDYIIPVQSGFGSASRLEKSEARHLLATWIDRSPLHRWASDRWHDRLAAVTAPAEPVRPRLLKYGMGPLPPPLVGLQFLLMITAIVAMQMFVFSTMAVDREGHSLNYAPAMLGQFAMMSMLIPLFACQFLATRRARLGQDLLLPMSRRALVIGLERQLRAITLWPLVAGVVVGTCIAWLLIPEQFTWLNIACVALTIVAVQPAMLAISFRLSLVQSGFKRVFGIVLVVYLLAGVASGLFALLRFVSLVGGTALAVGIFVFGVVCVRWARRAWLDAELG